MHNPDERLLTPRFVLVVATGLAYFLAIGMMLPTIPLFVKERLGGEEVAVGVAVGAFAVGAILLRPFAGRIGDRYGRRILIVAGAVVVAVAFGLVHVVTSMPMLVAARVLAGIGEAAFFVGAGTMVTDLAPVHRRGEALSYWSVAVYGGIALGPGLGVIVLQGDAYANVWTVSAVLSAVAAVLGFFTRETREPDAGSDAGTAGAAAGGEASGSGRPKLLYRLAIAPGFLLFLGMIGLAGFAEFVPLYVRDIGIDDAGAVLLVYGVVVLLVRVFGARVPDRIGPMVAGSLATGISAVGLVVIGVVASPFGLYAGTVIFGIGMSQLYPAMMILALTDVPDKERSSAVGTVSSFFDGAQGVGAVTLGGVAAVAGYRGAFIGGAVASLVALVLLRAGIDPRARLPIDPDAVQAAHEVPDIEVP